MSRFLCIPDLLEARSETNGPGRAISGIGGNGLTYDALCKLALRIVARLRSLGVNEQDTVALVMPNGPEMASAFLCIACGAICAPLNPNYRDAEFEFYLNDLNARALILLSGSETPARVVAIRLGIPVIDLVVDSSAAGEFALHDPSMQQMAEPGSVDFSGPANIALILHTSGTTSRPKMVPLTHANLCTSAHQIGETLALTESDRCLNIMPLFHIHGLVGCLLSSIYAGGSIVTTPGFSAPSFFGWLEEFKPTWYSAVPTMHQSILSRPEGSGAPAPENRYLRFIRSSSAALAPSVMRKLEDVFGVPVIESYGMTEASHQMASNPLPPLDRVPGSVGLAAGPEIAIMDESGELLPVDTTGEIVIKGPSVTAGYLHNDDANDAAFTNGYFRTGDQGILDDRGYLFLTGRLKEIINRGGEKISPREIDEVLLKHPDVAQAVAFAIPHPRLGEEVGAAVVVRPPSAMDERQLQEFVGTLLNPAKVPRKIIFLESIPKGPTGKLRRIGLASQLGLDNVFREITTSDSRPSDSEVLSDKKSTVDASNAIETAVVQIWEDVLKQSDIGPDDNFLVLGGDSILVGQILTRIEMQWSKQLTFIDFFDDPTPRRLAARIQSAGAAASAGSTASAISEDSAVSAVSAVSAGGTAADGKTHDRAANPASGAQIGFFIRDLLLNGSTPQNRVVSINLTGALEFASLRASLDAILSRHEVLRTNLSLSEEGVHQFVSSETHFPIQSIDLSSLSNREKDAELSRIQVEEANVLFSLEDGVLLRAAVCRLAADEHELIVTMHHALCDAASGHLFMSELVELYSRSIKGEAVELPLLEVQYRDYVASQDVFEQSDQFEEQLAFWTHQLHGVQKLELPTDLRRGGTVSRGGECVEFFLPSNQRRSINEFSLQFGGTPFMTLLTAFQVLLSRYSGQEDIIVGVPVTGRPSPRYGQLIGFFVNNLALRIDSSGSPTFREMAARVRSSALHAFSNQDIRIERLVERLKPKRTPNEHPFFRAMFNMESPTPPIWSTGGLVMVPRQIRSRISDADLILEITEEHDQYRCAFSFRRDLFLPETVKRMVSHYQTLLANALASPDRLIDRIPIMPAEERAFLLSSLTNHTVVYPQDRLLHELVDEQSARTPDVLAVTDGDFSLTYRELELATNRFARYLRSRSVGPEVIVGILMERSTDMIVAMLGIMKAGGMFLSINPAFPRTRMKEMLDDSGSRLIVSHRNLFTRMKDLGVEEARLEDADVSEFPDLPPESNVTSENGAYVMFTSGSTGRPKGVVIEHRHFRNYVLGVCDTLNFSGPLNYLLNLNLSFDACHTIILPSLVSGGTLHIIPEAFSMESDWISAYMRRCAIDVVKYTPSHLRTLATVASDPDGLLPARMLIMGGEASEWHWIKEMAETAPCRVVNHYGPAETTVGVLTYDVPIEKSERDVRFCPLGRPLPNVRIYVLDSSLEPVAPGLTGEIYIGGATVGRGYMRRPDLNGEKFVADPFAVDHFATNGYETVSDSTKTSHLMYRTGDLGRIGFDASGLPIVEFLGRDDNQVKIRGYRIELEGIETVLARHEDVERAVVSVYDLSEIDRRLIAYIVPAKRKSVSFDELRSHVRSILPEPLVPSEFVLIEAIPLSSNGKIDRSRMTRPLNSREPATTGTSESFDDTERIIKALWEKSLNVDNLSITDSFFDLGGHSILATIVMTHIRQAFNIDMEIRDIFDYPTIQSIAGRVRSLLSKHEKSPNQNPIPPMMATPVPTHINTLHGLFLAHVARRQDKPAVITPSRTLNYGDLNRASGNLAFQLRQSGVSHETPVAIVMEKGWEQIVGALAIMRAGGAFVPIDPSYPAKRLDFLFEDCAAKVILTQSWLESSIAFPPGTTVLNIDLIELEGYADAPDPGESKSDSLAMILYTSGTTGVPKGVLIEHRGMCNSIVATGDRFDLGPNDRTFFVTAFQHDLAMFDIFAALAAGGAIVIPEHRNRRDPAHWLDLMFKHRVSIWNSVPTIMEMVLEQAGRTTSGLPNTLRLAFLGGDWIPVSLPDRIRNLAPQVEVVSIGGPTEGSLWNIWYPVGEVNPEWKSIPYGRAIPNAACYIFDEHSREILDPGKAGELWASGVGLARGYLNNPTKTSESFISHPVSGERVYRTGDLARWMEDGNVELLGRIDLQINIDGRRIELEEIEAVLHGHPDVISSAATASKDGEGRLRIMGHVVHRSSVSTGQIREYLKLHLPEHMVPQFVLAYNVLPVTPNGKVDRVALAATTPAIASDVLVNTVFTRTEKAVSEIWVGLLGRHEIEQSSDFFDLGGHSLLALKFVSRVRDAFGVEMSIVSIFEFPTLKAISEVIDQLILNGESGGSNNREVFRF